MNVQLGESRQKIPKRTWQTTNMIDWIATVPTANRLVQDGDAAIPYHTAKGWMWLPSIIGVKKPGGCGAAPLIKSEKPANACNQVKFLETIAYELGSHPKAWFPLNRMPSIQLNLRLSVSTQSSRSNSTWTRSDLYNKNSKNFNRIWLSLISQSIVFYLIADWLKGFRSNSIDR